MARLLEDGVVAITVEDSGGLIRALSAVPTDDNPKPAYTTIGSWLRLSERIVKLYGFAGAGLTRRHMRLVVRWGLECGFSVAYIDRIEGHGVPFATRLTEGDFSGWWRLDLPAVRLSLGRFRARK